MDELILDEVSNPKSSKAYEDITQEQFKAGLLPQDVTKVLLDGNRDQIVLIAPMQLKRQFVRNARYWEHPEVVTPVLVPCTLTTEGELAARQGIMPWFVRDYLDPVVSASNVVVSSVDAVEKYIATKSDPFSELVWEKYYDFCMSMLHDLLDITDSGTMQLGEMPYAVSNMPRVYVDQGQSGAASNIKKLYDDLLNQEQAPKAYESFLNGFLGSRPLLSLEEEVDVAAQLHLGQMSSAFGLGPSQRKTIHHFLSTREGEILAVNGPPGTGKTTLLQSAIASLWVKAIIDAHDEQPSPPVVVATSSNNQAVTNVIRDFGGILRQKSNNPLEVRWIPEAVNSLGAYAVSDSKQKELDKDGNPFLSMWLAWSGSGYEWKGFFEQTEEASFVERAYTSYCQSYERFSGEKLACNERLQTLADIRKDLRSRLFAVAGKMQASLAAWKQCYRDDKRKSEIEKRLLEIPAAINRCEKLVSERVEVVSTVSVEIARAEQLAQQAATAIAHQPFWEGLLSFLGFVGERRAARAKAFVLQHRINLAANPKSLSAVGEHVDVLLNEVRNRYREVSAELSEAEQLLLKVKKEEAEQKALLTEFAQRLKALAKALALDEDRLEFSRCSLYSLLESFDKGERFEMFLLAVHYYEGLWLEDVVKKAGTKIKGEERFRRIAMLTPCIVSTLFMVPKFFRSSKGPLYEFIDLLILDEAGQAGPDKAAAVFALSKRALVVGDVYQIEPVYKLPKSVDLGNMKRNSIYDGREEDMPERLAVSMGSAMRMAQESSPYHCILGGRLAEERGMYLLEHRRCHKDIIGYCKELVYSHLEVHTKHEPDDFYLFPPLGYAHIPSSGKKKGGSWHNPYEAQNIAQWLADNRATILDRYNVQSLADVVAIVTPFTSQVSSLRQSMQDFLPESDYADMVVGTVHKLQGAERPIVLFSPVYGPGNVTVPFFDRGCNMLNVAVSRARHSFLVFGNMGMFEPGDRRPSQILGKHLQCIVKSGELDSFRLTPRRVHGRIEHLSTLEQHRATLRRAFEEAREQLFIVSPFLSLNAIHADGVLDMINAASRRGVLVQIYADSRLALTGCQNQQAKLDEISSCLENAGARLRFVNGLHNKTLIMDDHTLVEGSFNWLSARRDGLARMEHSILYQGEDVAGLKVETIESLEGLAI